jgi:hypothetical protein
VNLAQQQFGLDVGGGRSARAASCTTLHERDARACLDLNVSITPDYNPAALIWKEARMAETRKVIDCRRFPAEKPCSIAISGTEDEVVNLAVLHASTVHGHADSPELREQIRSMLEEDVVADSEAA